MRVLFISRATMYKGFGGDSVQLLSTAKYLRNQGVDVDIRLCNEKIDYSPYDLIHIFNVIRPADTLAHVRKSGKPYVLSTIFLDYDNYEKKHREGLLKWMNRFLSKSRTEYIKAIGRFIKNGEKVASPEYLWLGHKKSIQKLAKGASLLLPNSHSEYIRLRDFIGFDKEYRVVYNGIDHHQHAQYNNDIPKENDLVICAARIEGNKNQYNLIRALNNKEFRLKIIGKPAPNHLKYYEACRSIAASNVEFLGFVEEEELIRNFQRARVHILPSYCETCGLSSLEAAYHQCSLVITDGGDTGEYFQDQAFYCDPDDPVSILDAVRNASKTDYSKELYNKTKNELTWEYAAWQTLNAYKEVLGESEVLAQKDVKLKVMA